MKNTTTPQKPPASDPRPKRAGGGGVASTQSRPGRRRGPVSPPANASTLAIVHVRELKSSGLVDRQADTIAKVAYEAIAENVGPIRNELDDVKHDLDDVKHDLDDVKHNLDDVKHELVDVKATQKEHSGKLKTLTSEVRDLRKDIGRKFTLTLTLIFLVAGGGFQVYSNHIVPQINALSANVARLDEKVENIDKRLDTKFEYLDKKFEYLDKKLDKKFEYLDKKLDKKFEYLDKKIERLAVAMEQIAAAKGAKPAPAPGREGAEVDSPGRGPGPAAPGGRKAPSRQDSAPAFAKGAGRRDGEPGKRPGQGHGAEAGGDARTDAPPKVPTQLARTTEHENAAAAHRGPPAKPGICALAPARGWRDGAGAQPPSSGAAPAPAKPPLAQPSPSLSRRWGWLDGTAALARSPAPMPSAALAAALAPTPRP